MTAPINASQAGRGAAHFFKTTGAMGAALSGVTALPPPLPPPAAAAATTTTPSRAAVAGSSKPPALPVAAAGGSGAPAAAKQSARLSGRPPGPSAAAIPLGASSRSFFTPRRISPRATKTAGQQQQAASDLPPELAKLYAGVLPGLVSGGPAAWGAVVRTLRRAVPQLQVGDLGVALLLVDAEFMDVKLKGEGGEQLPRQLVIREYNSSNVVLTYEFELGSMCGLATQEDQHRCDIPELAKPFGRLQQQLRELCDSYIAKGHSGVVFITYGGDDFLSLNACGPVIDISKHPLMANGRGGELSLEDAFLKYSGCSGRPLQVKADGKKHSDWLDTWALRFLCQIVAWHSRMVAAAVNATP